LVPADLETWSATWHQTQSIQRVFQWAVDGLRVLKKNPFKDVKRPPAGMRTRILSPQELIDWLRACQQAFRHFFIAMLETMARPGEVRALRWPMLRAPIDWSGSIESAA
jgi:integrase